MGYETWGISHSVSQSGHSGCRLSWVHFGNKPFQKADGSLENLRTL